MNKLVNHSLIEAALACAPLSACAVAPGVEPALAGVEQASICGTTDESQPVNFYDGSFEQFSISFVNAHKGPVGALETTNSSSAGVKYCSGTLISESLFLTAAQCVGSATEGDYVSFNYELGQPFPSMPWLVGVLPQTHALVTKIVELDDDLDYAILRLAGSPGDTFGYTRVASADPAVGAAIAMIGISTTAPKKVEAGTVAGVAGDRMSYFNVDTVGGNVGAGILNSAGRLVGVHISSGCTTSGGANTAVRMSRISAASDQI